MEIRTQGLAEQMLKGSELIISYSGLVRTDETWHQDLLYAPYSRLYYVMEGAGMLVSEHEEMPLEPGYVYLAPCGLKYGFYGKDSVTKLFFHIHLPLLSGGYDAFSQCNRFIKLPRAVSYIEQLKSHYLDDDPYAHLILKGELWSDVCEALTVVKGSAKHFSAYSKPVSDAIAYIREHLTAGLKVAQIADAVFCSQSKLSTLFRVEVGQSVARYLDDLLMSEAQTMLIYSDRSVGEISESLGFCDQFYFSRRFTKRFSASPSHFRKARGER